METCKENGWKSTARNVEKAALDVSSYKLRERYKGIPLLVVP